MFDLCQLEQRFSPGGWTQTLLPPPSVFIYDEHRVNPCGKNTITYHYIFRARMLKCFKKDWPATPRCPPPSSPAIHIWGKYIIIYSKTHILIHWKQYNMYSTIRCYSNFIELLNLSKCKFLSLQLSFLKCFNECFCSYFISSMHNTNPTDSWSHSGCWSVNWKDSFYQPLYWLYLSNGIQPNDCCGGQLTWMWLLERCWRRLPASLQPSPCKTERAMGGGERETVKHPCQTQKRRLKQGARVCHTWPTPWPPSHWGMWWRLQSGCLMCKSPMPSKMPSSPQSSAAGTSIHWPAASGEQSTLQSPWSVAF